LFSAPFFNIAASAHSVTTYGSNQWLYNSVTPEVIIRPKRCIALGEYWSLLVSSRLLTSFMRCSQWKYHLSGRTNEWKRWTRRTARKHNVFIDTIRW